MRWWTKCMWIFYEDGVNETNYTKNCSCSRGDGNKRYCPLDTVSMEFEKTIWKMSDIIVENWNKHTMNRFKVDYEEERQLMYVFKYPRYKRADDCAINVDLMNHNQSLLYFLQ